MRQERSGWTPGDFGGDNTQVLPPFSTPSHKFRFGPWRGFNTNKEAFCRQLA